MGFDIDIDISLDEDEFKSQIADEAEDIFREWLETEAQDGKFECDCGSRSFDIETWTNASGETKAAGVCRECNERMEIDVDTSELDELR